MFLTAMQSSRGLSHGALTALPELAGERITLR
jgi:hypothetical protein